MSVTVFPSFKFTGQLKNRTPTVSAGLSLAIIVFVLLTSQIGLYFWRTPIHSRDRLWIKGIVVFIWIMQALECALACHMSVLAHSSDFPLAAGMARESLWEWSTYAGTSVATECLVHAFFISRIYLLGVKPVHTRISIILCAILIIEGSIGFIFALSFLSSVVSTGTEEHMVLTWSMPIWLGSSILADISIAGSMCYILRQHGPITSAKLSLLVKRLIKFSIQTGLITSLVTGITVALWLTAQLDVSHLLMSFPMSGIYAACLMSNLIARESYFHRQTDEVEDDFITTGNIEFATPETSEENKSFAS